MKRLAELGLALSGDPIDVFRHIAGMIGELLDVSVVNLSEIRGEELFFLSTYVKGDVQTYTGTCKLENTPCATVQEAKDLRVYHDVISKVPGSGFFTEVQCLYLLRISGTGRKRHGCGRDLHPR